MAKQLYTVVACNLDGEHLAEMKDQSWYNVSSLIAAWTKMFKSGMDAGQGLKWDQDGYIQVFPQFK